MELRFALRLFVYWHWQQLPLLETSGKIGEIVDKRQGKSYHGGSCSGTRKPAARMKQKMISKKKRPDLVARSSLLKFMKVAA
jgi:hypothetical protein